MSLFKRGGVWWYDFRVQGTRVRETTGSRPKSAAAEAEALRRAEVARNGSIPPDHRPPSPKFADFALDDFCAWSKNQHRAHPSTHERYMRSVKVLLRFFGGQPLDTISAAAVEHFKIRRSRERRKYAKDGRLVTPAALNRDLAVLRILFNLAIRSNKARRNPMLGVKMLPEENLRMRVLSLEEQAAYLSAASQPLRDVATLILETGMRPGEVSHLRKENINLELAFLRIPAGKTQFARRTIPLTHRAREVISRRIGVASSEWLFPSRHDASRPLNWLRKAHIGALRNARIDLAARLYDLRHIALTRMAMAGMDLPTLRELAGHASIQMTMRYVHPTPEHKRNSMLKFEAYCGSASDALSAAKPSDGTSQTSTTEQLRGGLARITVVS